MSATVKTSLRDLQQGLTLRPLVFEKKPHSPGRQDSNKEISFVEPYYIKEDEPPITIGDVKELKTYLKMIMRCESSYYKGKHKLRRVFKRNTSSSTEPLNYLREGFTKKIPEGMPKVDGYRCTKKQLEKAAKKAKKLAKGSGDETKQNYAEYLELLLGARKMRGGFDLDNLKKLAEEQVSTLLAEMKLRKEDKKRLIPASLRGYLERAANSTEKSAESSLWTEKLKNAMNKLQGVSDKYGEIAKQKYAEIKTNYAELEKDDKEPPDTQEPWTPEKMNYRDLGNVGVQKELTENYCERLEDLIKKFRELTQEIEPFAEKLFANAAKAKVYGLDTLYTKLSDKLQKSSDKLETKIAEMYDKKSEMIAISTGLDQLTRGGSGNKLQYTKSWKDILARINGINRGFEKCAEQLQNRHLYKNHAELANTLARLTDQIADLVGEKGPLRNASTKTKASRTNLNEYNLRVSENLEKAEADMAEYSTAYKAARTLLDTAGRTVMGKLLLFKEKNKTTLEALKTLGNVASTFREKLPM